MKIFSFLMIFISLRTMGGIIDQDDRRSLLDVNDERLLQISKSIAALIHKNNIKSLGHGRYEIISPPLSNYAEFYAKSETGKDWKACDKDRFGKYYEEMTAALCTGSLIASDQILTAGHCMMDIVGIDQTVWVFNYDDINLRKNDGRMIVTEEDIFSSRGLLIFSYSPWSDVKDLAVVQLEKKSQRPTLTLPSFSSPSESYEGTNVVTIGYPLKVPQKITLNGKITTQWTKAGESRHVNNKKVINYDLDVQSGNSGGPIFDAKSYSILAVHNTGLDDFHWGTKLYSSWEFPVSKCVLQANYFSLKYPEGSGRKNHLRYSGEGSLVSQKDLESLEYLKKVQLNFKFQAEIDFYHYPEFKLLNANSLFRKVFYNSSIAGHPLPVESTCSIASASESSGIINCEGDWQIDLPHSTKNLPITIQAYYRPNIGQDLVNHPLINANLAIALNGKAAPLEAKYSRPESSSMMDVYQGIYRIDFPVDID